MNFESVDAVLEYAIGKEKEAVVFYNDLSKIESSAALQETFKKLAQEEGTHIKKLVGISKNRVMLDSYELKPVTDLKISDYMVEKQYSEGMDMQDILHLAMKREEMAVKLYTDLAKSSDNAEFTKLFQVLAQEEAQHKFAFESMYDDFLSEQGN